MDYSYSSTSLHHQQAEDLIHEDLLCWAFSPEPPFVLVSDIMPSPVAEAPATAAAKPPASAFFRYVEPENRSLAEYPVVRSSEAPSMQRRMIEILRRIQVVRAERGGDGEGESRGFRHMMRERQRREKLSQSYSDLHAMVAFRSKGDKNSIVQASTAYLRELKKAKEELLRRNEQLKARISGRTNDGMAGGDQRGTKIKIQVAKTASAMESMIGALRCLQGMGSKASSIRSSCSGGDLFAVVAIDVQVSTSEVERAVQVSLVEVEEKLRGQLPGRHEIPSERHVAVVI